MLRHLLIVFSVGVPFVVCLRCYLELKQAIEQEHTAVVPFVEVSAHVFTAIATPCELPPQQLQLGANSNSVRVRLPKCPPHTPCLPLSSYLRPILGASQVGFYESVLSADNNCYHFAAQCPPPVDLLFMNDTVGDSDDYFEVCGVGTWERATGVGAVTLS